MAFIPHSDADIEAMLKIIGETSIDALFDEVPASLKLDKPLAVLEALTEIEMAQHMKSRAALDDGFLNFIGAGSYEHFIPAAVWELVSRGEFLTAYTPYQAEASQGGLQLIYEYQTMIASLCGLDVANASVYGGANALAESLLLAVRDNRKHKKVLIAGTLHPHYRDTIKTILSFQAIEVVETGFNEETGLINIDAVEISDCAAFVIVQPNFFGALEDVDQLTDWAHENNMKVIACVNPTTLALLKAPGQWGENGADIACGEGQPLGVPMASGGPYFGFMACKKSLVRQMPGRIVGRTVDTKGRVGYALTLQAREQHIRRGKAKSNICTNQGLLVTAAVIYMTLLGFDGLNKVATSCVQKSQQLKRLLADIPNVKLHFSAHCFHEFVIELPMTASEVLDGMLQHKIIAGLDLGKYFQQLENCILVCVTETKSDEDMVLYQQTLQHVLGA